MSKEFIEKGINSSLIHEAYRQERQLSYFLESETSSDFITQDYIKEWASRKYQTNDYFLNFVKSIFRTDVFLKFYKFLRKPLPSTKLIKTEIEPQLKRVFIAEDSDEYYNVEGVDYSQIKKDLNTEHFEDEVFYRLLYKHNSIVISDVKDGKAYRYFVDIYKVRSIEESDGKIIRLAFSGFVNDEEGFIYIDNNVYEFYNKDYELINSVPHALGYCPAHYVSKARMNGKDVVKVSFYSYIREELEEYVFLKTLQKMAEPNGVFPITTKLRTDEEDDGDIDSQGGKPTTIDLLDSQTPSEFSSLVPKGTGDLEPGVVHELDPLKKDDGSIDIDAVRYLINFHYLPVEAMQFIDERITNIEKSIVTSLIGVIDESGEGSKNELQIEKSMNTLQTNLILISEAMSRIRKLSDSDVLALNYGIKKVKKVYVFYGTDHYLDSQSKLFSDLEKAPNPIEKKNILLRINKNKYKGNPSQVLRQEILYDLIPFVSKEEFDEVKEYIDNVTLLYYVRFNYWVSKFEAMYGDLVTFYSETNGQKKQKMDLINKLIIQIINENNLHFNKTSSLAQSTDGSGVRGNSAKDE